MGRSRNNDESAEIKKKSQLVMNICNISLRASSCAHNNNKRRFFRPERSHFVDWYLVLGIYESAGVDVIKKRYHRLALQLHPDKNKHPKAEIAFKLAYVCLSDNARRSTFDLQRQSNFCNECCKNPYPPNKLLPPPKVVKSSNVWQILKDLKSIFSQEATVIENCMKINANGMKEPRTCNARLNRDEYPIFNPSDYVFHGYPHHRNQSSVHSCQIHLVRACHKGSF